MAHITVHGGPSNARAELEELAEDRRLEQQAQNLRSRAEHAEAISKGEETRRAAEDEQERLRQAARAEHAERRQRVLAQERGGPAATVTEQAASGPTTA